MPASVIVVHDDLTFLNDTVAALIRAGYDAAGFADSMTALNAFSSAKRFDLLITRVQFPIGQPNGVSLGRMATTWRPGVKVLFTTQSDAIEFTHGVGEVLMAPMTAQDVVAKVAEMLAEPDD